MLSEKKTEADRNRRRYTTHTNTDVRVAMVIHSNLDRTAVLTEKHSVTYLSESGC